MNQIIFLNNKYKYFFKIQFFISLLFIISIVLLYHYDLNNSKKLEDISNLIKSNAKILNIYQIENSSYLGKLIIDKIELEYIVFKDFSDDLLKISPCKFSGPNLGENGNICIVGHNYENKKFFSEIEKLEINDEILIDNLKNKIYRYIVYEKNEVNENDFSITKSKKKSELTLVTCNNTNNKRIIIKSYEKNNNFD